MLDWLQFAYNVDWFGVYVAADSTEFIFHTLLERKLIFAPYIPQLTTLHPGVYA